MEQQADGVVAAVELVGEPLHVSQCRIHLAHGSSIVDGLEVVGNRHHIVADAVQLAGQRRHIVAHHTVELLAGGVEVGRQPLYVVERSRQGRVSQQVVERAEDGVQLGQHPLHLGHHVAHLSHHAVVECTLQGVAHLHALARVVRQQERHLHASQHVGGQFSRTSGRDAQLRIYINLSHYTSSSGVVVDEVAHDAYPIAVRKDRSRFRQPIDVGKFHVEIAGRLKQVDSLQVVDTIDQDAEGCNARYADSHFFG